MAVENVPLIFSPIAPRVRVHWPGRILALAVSLGCLAGMLTAAALVPSPSGVGTHTALGLSECSFLHITGIPCWSCGMTTSWAWFARGNLAASLWVQPMGTLLAVLTALTFWAGLYIALTGRAAHHLIRYLPAGYTLPTLLVLALLGWAWKIFIHLHHLDGWQ